MPQSHPLHDEQKLDRLEQARELLAFPDIDDNDWIVEEVMKLLNVKRGKTTEM